MKLICTLILYVSCCFTINAQFTLKYCQEKARENYPLIKQFDLIEESKKYNISQINKVYIPQLSLNGRVSWQTDVTEFPEEFNNLLDRINMSITFPGQDQYNVSLELTQTIWDGGITTSHKKSISAQNEVDKYNIEVNLYALTEQINQLYFSILLLNEQKIQNTLLLNELERNYKLISSYEENGLAQQSDLDEIHVEILSARQNNVQMETSKKTLIKVLSAFIGEEIDYEAEFIKPDAEVILGSTSICRPELQLFESQISLLETQNSQLWSKGMPRIALFATGAYGNPGLNMFKSGFVPYFIGGIQFNWNFGGLYTNNDEKSTYNNKKQQIEVQREVFLFNIQQEINQKDSEIEKLQQLLESDEEIIRLRESIQKGSELKVENGVMSVGDLMRDINSANVVRQTKAYHEIQLLKAIWELNEIRGY